MGKMFSGQRPFLFSLIGCVQFVIVTFVAMLFYPGGTIADAMTGRYIFTANFFSDLGITVAHNGQPNPVAAILFFMTLTVAGGGLAVYFLAIPKYFRASWVQQGLSLLGSLFGVLSGLSFAGIAFTPGNLAGTAHTLFVQLAFSTFFVAVLCYIPAVFLNDKFSNVYTAVYTLFAICLAAYLWLIFGNIALGAQALTVHVVSQKLIVYAAIICMGIQSYGAYQLAGNVVTAVPVMAD